ncbi:putative callose synthase 6, partial [Mucuna pruriens]
MGFTMEKQNISCSYSALRVAYIDETKETKDGKFQEVYYSVLVKGGDKYDESKFKSLGNKRFHVSMKWWLLYKTRNPLNNKVLWYFEWVIDLVVPVPRIEDVQILGKEKLPSLSESEETMTISHA